MNISITDDGNVVTKIYVFEGISSQSLGIVLGSAVKVAANALMIVKKLSPADREQIEAEIVDCMEKELREGDHTEDITTHLE